jgi:hypothetical protein
VLGHGVASLVRAPVTGDPHACCVPFEYGGMAAPAQSDDTRARQLAYM